MITVKPFRPMMAGAVAALALAGCATTPPSSPELEAAERRLAELRGDADVSRYADDALSEADAAVAALASAVAAPATASEIDSRVFIAERRLETARLIADEGSLGAEIEALEDERDRIVAAAREADLERAQARARQAEVRAAVERAEAEERLRRTEERAQSEVAAAAARAEAAETRAETLQAALSEALQELQAQETERGLLITLSGAVLFEVDSDEVKPGGRDQLARVATALEGESVAERRILVEGHTDATGDDAYNLDLSQRRADSVKAILVSEGVSAERIEATGLGETRPAATNDTAEGRQQNRRVEIVILN